MDQNLIAANVVEQLPIFDSLSGICTLWVPTLRVINELVPYSYFLFLSRSLNILLLGLISCPLLLGFPSRMY